MQDAVRMLTERKLLKLMARVYVIEETCRRTLQPITVQRNLNLFFGSVNRIHKT